MDIPREKPQRITIDCHADGSFDFDIDGTKMQYRDGDMEYRVLDDICRRLYRVKINTLMKDRDGT